MSRMRTPDGFGGACQFGKDTARMPKRKPPGRSVRPGGLYGLKVAGSKSGCELELDALLRVRARERNGQRLSSLHCDWKIPVQFRIGLLVASVDPVLSWFHH